MEKEELTPDHIHVLMKKHAMTEKSKVTDEEKKIEDQLGKGDVTATDDVRPEDSVSQQGTKVSRQSSRRSLTSSVNSAAREELMRSAARKAGLLAKMEALKDQATEEIKLQSLIKELEFKKQQGALMAQLAEEGAVQKVYAQCGGSRVGTVHSVLAASPQLQHQTPQTLNAEAPAFQPQVDLKPQDLKGNMKMSTVKKKVLVDSKSKWQMNQS